MRSGRVLVMAIVSSVALAGCTTSLGSNSEDGERHDRPVNDRHDWAEYALTWPDDHDHRNASHHAGFSTPHFTIRGFDPLITDYHGTSSAGYFCGQAVDNGDRRLAFVHSFFSDVALVVTDVTDPAAPFVVGELVLPLTHVYDVAATADAQRVVLATSPLDTGPDAESEAPTRGPLAAGDARPYFVDACTGEKRVVDAPLPDEPPYASGVVLVDVTDPANPTVSDYRPLPALGAHSVFVGDVGGEPLVLASVTNLAHHASYFVFYSILESPLGPALVEESVYRPAPLDEEAPVINGHVDGWIHEHPVTGAATAYLADWDGGLVILDVSNPKVPLELARWNDHEFQGSNDNGNVHGAYPLNVTWDGRHYTLVGQEVTRRPSDTPTGVVFVLDTTDPANPERIGAWTLPHNVEWEETLQFSTHYTRVLDRTMFVGMYHAGVWAVDLADPTNPRSTGVFVPVKESPAPAPEELSGVYSWTPIVLDLEVLPSGDLVVWDGTAGVYVVSWSKDPEIGSPEPWPIPG